MKAPDYLRSLIPGVERAHIVSTNTHSTVPYPGEPPMVDQHIVESPLTEQMPEVPTIDAAPVVETVSTNVPRHLHKYVRGEHEGWDRGVKTYRYTCSCGTWKVDT